VRRAEMVVHLCRIQILRVANDRGREERIRIRKVRAHVGLRIQIEHLLPSRLTLADRVDGVRAPKRLQELLRQAGGYSPLHLRWDSSFPRVCLPQAQSL